MPESKGRVMGPNQKHNVVLYAISTCIWCRRTRQLLEDQGLAFDYVYIDLLEGPERQDALAQVRRFNPAPSFPTLVIDGTSCIVGFQPDEIGKAIA